MEKEQIIKALERVQSHGKDTAYNAFTTVTDALALIKELTEECENYKSIAEYQQNCNMDRGFKIKRLTEKNKVLTAELSRYTENCKQMVEQTKADTVKRFAERLKEAPIKVGLPLFGLATKNEIEDYANGLMLQMRDAIDRIAEEMLKLRECPQCKHFVGCEPSTLGVCDMYEEDEKK